MNGLLDPATLALLTAGGGLLQAGGPSRMPVSTGQAMGQGLLQGVGAYQNGVMAQQQYGMNQAKMDEFRRAQEAQAQRDAEIARFEQSLPPEQRARFRIDPKGFLERKVVAPGGAVYSGIGTEFTAPMQAPKPSFAESDLTPEQAREFALNKGRAGATQVNVGPTGIDYGQAPSGMAWARNPDGTVALRKTPQGFMQPIAVPIAGGPVETKAAEVAKAADEQRRQQVTYADVVTQDVGRAIDMVEKSQVPLTWIGSLASALPGTPAHDLSNLVNTIKANIGFDRLQQMRAASPTGGALGQVSEQENKLLQSTIGALEQSQGKDQFLYNLRRVNDLYLDIIHGPGARPAGAKPAAGRPQISPETQKLLDKYAPRAR